MDPVIRRLGLARQRLGDRRPRPRRVTKRMADMAQQPPARRRLRPRGKPRLEERARPFKLAPLGAVAAEHQRLVPLEIHVDPHVVGEGDPPCPPDVVAPVRIGPFQPEMPRHAGMDREFLIGEGEGGDRPRQAPQQPARQADDLAEPGDQREQHALARMAGGEEERRLGRLRAQERGHRIEPRRLIAPRLGGEPHLAPPVEPHRLGDVQGEVAGERLLPAHPLGQHAVEEGIAELGGKRPLAADMGGVDVARMAFIGVGPEEGGVAVGEGGAAGAPGAGREFAGDGGGEVEELFDEEVGGLERGGGVRGERVVARDVAGFGAEGGVDGAAEDVREHEGLAVADEDDAPHERLLPERVSLRRPFLPRLEGAASFRAAFCGAARAHTSPPRPGRERR